jgi:competence protein ComEA
VKPDFWKGYFTFSRKERRAVIVLLLLVTGIFLLPHWLPDTAASTEQAASIVFKSTAAEQETAHKKVTGSGTRKKFNVGDNHGNRADYEQERPDAALFPFDPNAASDEEWKKLGLKEKTIGTIRKYLLKGGRFRKPDDIRRIYGLSEQKAEQLINYVRIENEVVERRTTQTAYIKQPGGAQGMKDGVWKKPAFQIIDINGADTASLIALPGIGSKLAQRIVLFRDKLGGFHSIDQVAEVYGLADSTFQKIKPRLDITGISVKKLNVNNAELNMLAEHPYIGRTAAKTIIAYRQQHGLFRTIADLKNIHGVSENVWEKAFPYLSTE